MKIVIGSMNPAKVAAVKAIFLHQKVGAMDVQTDVSKQPFSDKETRAGAINRARHCKELTEGATGIGLEGGVMYIDEDLYLCSWGALVTPKNQVYTASGARILLPTEIAEQLSDGEELGDIIDGYANKINIREHEGAIGILTNDYVSRREMFSHIVKLLKGQLDYDQNKNTVG